MDVTLRKITLKDVSDFKLMEKWDNDEDIKHFLRPNFKEEELSYLTYEEVMISFSKSKDKHIYMIEADNNVIGNISIDNDFPYLIDKEKKTSWISICIGEKNYHGRGISTIVMTKIFDLCKEFESERIELGVFEYNKKAIKLYEKMGYKEVTRLNNFTYYNGRFHDDIRMEIYI